MATREVLAVGLGAQMLATDLLQRVRVVDPSAGVWEAADMQWWWRKPRVSDHVQKVFWIDDDGPVAGVVLTAESHGSWQVDPLIVPGAGGVAPEQVWERALELGAEHSPGGFDVPVADGDPAFAELAGQSGFDVGLRDDTGWLEAADRPELASVPAEFTIVARSDRPGSKHPLAKRNGEAVARRLDQCTLYDADLDLWVTTTDGDVAAYALFWFDPVTKVGLVEPVRTEDAFQRRGLADAVLREGIDRLIDRGAQRVKISYQSAAAAATYERVGFVPTSTTSWYSCVVDPT